LQKPAQVALQPDLWRRQRY